MGLTCYTEVT